MDFFKKLRDLFNRDFLVDYNYHIVVMKGSRTILSASFTPDNTLIANAVSIMLKSLDKIELNGKKYNISVTRLYQHPTENQ